MELIIDNYDSFTFNLYQLIGSVTADVKVVRNDKISVEEIDALHPDHIILSPGPGNPQQAGICLEVIEKLAGKYPILGVCLGHQAIGEAFGGKVIHAPQIVHGKADKIYKTADSKLLENVPDGFEAARYHSLVIDKNSLPECLMVTAMTADKEIMAVEHKKYPVYGVQFHPESIMTPQGRTIVENFLKM